MKKILYVMLAVGFFSLTAFESTDYVAENENMTMVFMADLSGSNEVPPVASEASGKAIFRLSKDGSMLHYKLLVFDIEDVTAAHIHLAPAGINGGAVVLLSGPALGSVNGMLAGGVLTEGDLWGGKTMSELVESMMDGGAYVNVHTAANPSGEIRGQISETLHGGGN